MRKCDAEQCSVSRMPDGVDVAIEMAQDSFANRRSESDAFAAAVVQLDKGLENAPLIDGGESLALVPHVNAAPIRMLVAGGGQVFLGEVGFNRKIRFSRASSPLVSMVGMPKFFRCRMASPMSSRTTMWIYFWCPVSVACVPGVRGSWPRTEHWSAPTRRCPPFPAIESRHASGKTCRPVNTPAGNPRGWRSIAMNGTSW